MRTNIDMSDVGNLRGYLEKFYPFDIPKDNFLIEHEIAKPKKNRLSKKSDDEDYRANRIGMFNYGTCAPSVLAF